MHEYGKFYEEKPKEAESEFKRVKEIAEHKAALRRAARKDGAPATAKPAVGARPASAVSHSRQNSTAASHSRQNSTAGAISHSRQSSIASISSIAGAGISRTVTSARPKTAKAGPSFSSSMGASSQRAAGVRSASVSSTNAFWRPAKEAAGSQSSYTAADRARPGFVDVFH